MKLAIDSNIFIAFLQKDEAFFKPAAEILKNIADGKHYAVFSTLTYGEVMYGAPRYGSLQAVKLFFRSLRGAEPIAANGEICFLAAELRLKYPSLKLPDAIHLATALVASTDKFVTADRRLYTITAKEMKSELVIPTKT